MTAFDGAGRTPAPGGVDRRTGRRRSIGVAVRLFPRAWQERYGTEFAALLEATPISIRVLFDVLVSAVDAHVHPTGPRRRWPLMIERLRLSELAVFASWVIFVVAGLAFQRMTEGAPFAAIAAAQPGIGWPYLAVTAGAVLSLCAVIFAGLPIALAIARSARAGRNGRQLALLGVPPAALSIWVGLTAALLVLGDPPAGGPWRVAVFLVWVGAFVLAAIASTVAVGAAALDADVDEELYRRAVAPAVITAIAMVVVTLAVVVWGVALAATSPAAFWGSDGLLGSSTPLTWLGIAVVMAGASAAAIRAAIDTRREPAG